MSNNTDRGAPRDFNDEFQRDDDSFEPEFEPAQTRTNVAEHRVEAPSEVWTETASY